MENWKRLCGSMTGAIAAVVGLSVSSIAAEAADDLSTFVTTYHCTVAELIARIHTHPHPERMRRYLILESAVTHDYVQCLFFDRDRQMLCEAESGWWNKAGENPHFVPAGKQALAHLGFSMDASHGNFQRYFRFQSGPDDGDVADLMLRALYEGYGTRIKGGIMGNGPFATHRGMLPRDRCVPVS